ncbi:MAG: hypothetical protein N2250_09375 [Pseudothermotoga sp.]|nr:hypothetical protein [Pseudothermotoga sp.]
MYEQKVKYWPKDKDDEERILDWINDTLRDWNYIKGDITCDGMHYASIRGLSRKEIIPSDKLKDGELLKYALELLGINKDQLIEKYKTKK